jgi:hypothetical protein
MWIVQIKNCAIFLKKNPEWKAVTATKKYLYEEGLELPRRYCQILKLCSTIVLSFLWTLEGPSPHTNITSTTIYVYVNTVAYCKTHYSWQEV